MGVQEFEGIEDNDLKVVVTIFVGKIVDVVVVDIVGLVVVTCLQREALTNLISKVGFEISKEPISAMA